MKTEITIQQPLAGGPWAYMVTRDGRPIAWGDAGTKHQALNEAATACGVRPHWETWLIVDWLVAALFGLMCWAAALADYIKERRKCFTWIFQAKRRMS